MSQGAMSYVQVLDAFTLAPSYVHQRRIVDEILIFFIDHGRRFVDFERRPDTS